MSKNTASTYVTERLTEARSAVNKLSAVEKRTPDQDEALEAAIDDTLRLESARSTFDVKVKSEPLTYSRGDQHSWFRDLYAEARGVPVPGGTQRLQSNNVEMRSLREIDNARGIKNLEQLNLRTGDLSALTASAGGVFLPPQYILDEFASVVRTAGTIRSKMRSVTMPESGMTINVPRFTAADSFPIDDTENTTHDLGYTSTDEVTHPVSSFFGTVSVSEQLLSRGNIDQFLAIDFAENYVASVEAEIVTGDGTGQEFLGLLSVSGATANTYTAATPNPVELLAKIGVLVAQTSAARNRPVSAVFMNSATWLYLASSIDTTGVSADRPGVGPAIAGDTACVATLFGFPVYLSEGMPTNLGGGTNQSVVIAAHTNDLILLESTPQFDVVIGASGHGNQLTADARYRAYATFISDRYPSSIGVLGGTGLSIPSDWTV